MPEIRGASPRMGQTAARTDTLLSRPETGKMTASVVSIMAGWHPAMPGSTRTMAGRFGREGSGGKVRGGAARARRSHPRERIGAGRHRAPPVELLDPPRLSDR